MKFARIVFLLAGIWGFLILTPLYFMEPEFARKLQPIAHPEYYYGFLSVALAWQFLFLLLAKDPARYRFMMLPAIVEKAGFVLTMFILYQSDRISAPTAGISSIDLLWAILFACSFLKTKPNNPAD
jgi:hypothetical protein